MVSVLSWLAPTLGSFLLGYLAKRLNIVPAKAGDWLLKLGFNVTIPALSLVSVSQVELVPELLVFTVLPAILLGITFPVSRFLSKRAKMPRPTEGVILTAPMTINSVMVMSFALAAFGTDGALRVILFNAGFNPLLFLWVYALAISYNPQGSNAKDVWKKIALSPPVWALIAGLILNVSNVAIPSPLVDTLRAIGSTTAITAIIALGILFNPTPAHRAIALKIVAVRMALGFVVGLAVVSVLQLSGIDRAVVLALASAPVGFNLVTFASLQHLDKALAASVVSYAVPIGLVVIPAILLLAG